jgi:flagellar basal body P-ring formation protein FlgA
MSKKFLISFFFIIFIAKLSFAECIDKINDYADFEKLMMKEISDKYAEYSDIRIIPDQSSISLFTSNLCVNNIHIMPRGSRFTAMITNDVATSFEIRGIYEVFDNVVMVITRINRNDVIDAKMINIDKVNITNISGELVKDIDKIINMRAVNNIMTGKPILLNDVTLPNIIEKGQKVTIIYENRGLKIKMTGLALDSGKLGDMIRARNTKSNATISGVVKGEGLLQVTN